jgi:diguanylate cyclase (GGDEF)-like protein
MGVIFWSCKQLERALDLCRQAVTLARPLGDPIALGWWLINLAGVHADIGYRAEKTGQETEHREALETALVINQEAIDLAAAQGDIWCLRLGLCNAAEYLTAAAKPGALEHLERCERLPGFSGQRSTAHFLYTKAQVLTRLGRFDDALPACREALSLAEEGRSLESATHALRYLSEIYEGLGQFEQALAWFKRFHDSSALLAAETIQRQARIAEIRYQTNKFRALADTEQRRAEQLTRTTLLDPLTGIANRRRFDETLLRLEAERTPFAIAMVDLDHFKSVNDRFSHLTGDEVLKRVGATLVDACRFDDLAVRMGGEEFAVVIDGADLDEARQFCLSLRRRLALVPWGELHDGLRVTASIGVATSLEAAGTRAVLALADARLYQAKQTGRDRVVSWTPTAATTVAV